MPRRPSGIRADRGYSYRELERCAADVREHLDLPPDVAINTMWLFDKLDITAQARTGQDIPIHGYVIELEDLEGFTKYDKDRQIIEILASAQTYEWLEQDHPRSRYFLAHELGHCLLHTDQLVRLAKMPMAQCGALHRNRQLSVHEIYRDTEWQANAFASALLMPARGLQALEKKHRDGLCPIKIAAHFLVSVEAAGSRLTLYNDRKPQLL